MKKTLTLLLIPVFVVFLGGIVRIYADQPMSQSVASTKTSDRPYDFSEVTRGAVLDSQGQYLGRIMDFVLNPDGRISFALLSQSWMVGNYERLVAVPFDALSFNDKGKRIILDTTLDKLAKAPLFQRSYLGARTWAEDSNRYFGIEPSWGGGKEATLCEQATATDHRMAMTKGWDHPYAFTDIIGMKVRNSQGQELGKIDDLVFDNEGRVFFAIIGYGGFIGIGKTLVAVPVNSLSYVDEPRYFVMNANEEKIQSAPLFSSKALDDPAWAKDVNRYFSQQPSWTEKN